MGREYAVVYNPRVKAYDEQRREWRQGYLGDRFYCKFIVDYTERGFFAVPDQFEPTGDGRRLHPQVNHPHISNQCSPDAALAPPGGFGTVEEAKAWVESEWKRMCEEAPYQRFRYAGKSWQRAIDNYLDRAGVVP